MGWTECHDTTPMPSTDLPTTTTSTTVTTSSETPCARETDISACVSQNGVFECKLCAGADRVSSEPCCSCQSGEPSSVTSTTTVRPATTTATTGSTPPPSELCKSWCGGHVQPWDKKCTWRKCSGCANAAIGEINSTLIASTGPFPTTPAPPCLEQCSSAPAQNTPECNGQTKERCQQMVQYENKCQWTECHDTTPMPSTDLPTTTTSTTVTTSSETPCARETDISACVSQNGVFECKLCAGADRVSSEPCCSCQSGEPSSVTSTTTVRPATTTTTT